jgi:tRNA A37 threonylcarbamoyladenosine dehydratase
LLGEKHNILKNSNVLVAGLGGVGGICAEMICRAGVGKMTIVDSDFINISNLNRQIYTTNQNIGKQKALELGQKLKSINPDLELTIITEYLKDDSIIHLIENNKFDYVVDAIDTIAPKVYLIYYAVKNNLKLVSSMGAGGKLDPTMVRVDDISKSHDCQLARIVRKRLHRLGVRDGFKVVYSPEKRDISTLQFIEAENKKTTLGTISYIPAIFGIYCSWVVINGIINEK